MIFQYALIVGLILSFGYGLTQYRRSRAPSAAMMLFSIIGCMLVVAPNFANLIANFVGIGRGADLLLYCFSVIVFVAIFNIHLRMRAQNDSLTDIARSIALINAIRPKNDQTCDN